MSRIVFQIGRKYSALRNLPVLSWLIGDTLKKALADDCEVSLTVDQDGEIRHRTGWGEDLTSSQLLTFLGEYRNNPGSTRPEENIRNGLHHFLFAGGAFDQAVAEVFERNHRTNERSEILIRGDASSLPLILNIPWELTASAPILPGRSSDLGGTLAALQIARVIANTRTQLEAFDERLRVVYCISEPPEEDSLEAKDFNEALLDVLRRRIGMLRFEPVINNDFTPKFSHLLAAIERVRPHIVIIICHGETVDGVPQLRFENWKPVSALGDALADNGKTFLAVLIACDQTHLAEKPAAHSGAVTLLEKGILSVVAMQSSVSTLLAKEFLGATLDRFFESGSVSLAVAEGRKSMAPAASDVARIVDWSFPVLFLSEDAPQHIEKLERLVGAYIPALDEMLRRIPRPKLYLERPEIDQRLLDLLKVDVTGLREVTGAVYNGKTTAILNASRSALQDSIERADTTTRVVLYLDFARYRQTPQTARALNEILLKQTKEIQSSGGGTPLLTWSAARGADGNGGTLDSAGLITLIDENRMVLILDNLDQLDESFWTEFFERARNLSSSLVIILRETGETGDIEIPAFTPDEVTEYVKRFAPSHVADANEWHTWSGGVAGQLDLLRRSDGERDAVSMNAAFFTKRLSAAEQDILYTFVSLPNGVDSELASSFVTRDWRDLLKLSQKGLLLRESRFGVTSSWFRLPQLLMRSLQDDLEASANGSVVLAERFTEVIKSADNPQQALIDLASRSGGIDFIHDIHECLLGVEQFEVAHAIPLLLHEWLLSRGLWFDAFRLWDRLLSTTSFEMSEPHEWIKFAKVAHILGFGQRAMQLLDSIAKSSDKELTKIDKIDNRLQRLLIIKDLGYIYKAELVTAEFESILAAIETEKSTLAQSENEKARFLEGKYALTIYDRAPHRRYWLRDLPGALSDLEEAGRIFGRLNNSRMKAMADCLWVDVQLDWRDHQKDWAEMLERLVKANETLKTVGGAAGDSAFCYYQMARYYRRKPASTPDESKDNVAAARTAYQCAVEQAQIAGDTRQEEIANGKFVEVSLELGLMDPTEATGKLRRVISILSTYKEDAWSTRVVRDMSLLLSRVRRESDPKNATAEYKNAWKAANEFPLHPAHGKDSWRAARILTEYLEELEKNDQKVEADTVSVLAKDLIEQWLSHEIDPTKRDEWIHEVRQYSAG